MEYLNQEIKVMALRLAYLIGFSSAVTENVALPVPNVPLTAEVVEILPIPTQVKAPDKPLQLSLF